MSRRLSGPRYWGGKQGIASWIVENLPPASRNQAYVEPYCGMASVLLARPPAGRELINDGSLLVVSWWEAIRDHPDELERMMRLTPHAREMRKEAYTISREPAEYPLLKRAWAFQVLTKQSYRGQMNVPKTWTWTHNPSGSWAPFVHPDYRRLAERIAEVQLESRDATWILERFVDVEHAVIYCDPPFVGPTIDPYLASMPDGLPVDLLLAQKGKVMVSGCEANDWTALETAGWRKIERLRKSKSTGDPITDMLWVNYPPPDSGTIWNLEL